MVEKKKLTAPFFEIGPKSYLYGDDVLKLAQAADCMAMRYDVDVLFTAPFTEIRRISEMVERVIVLAPHMDAIHPGRGIASILPEGIKAAGAGGVMLNHCEMPLSYEVLRRTMKRAEELELLTVVCTASLEEARAVSSLSPDVIVVELPELVGTGIGATSESIMEIVTAVRDVNPEVLILTAAGVTGSSDVYKNIYAGADATGASSGIMCAKKPIKIMDEMIKMVRTAYDERLKGFGMVQRDG